MYLGLLVVLFVFTNGISSISDFVKYREVHMNTELSCHDPTGTRTWYYKKTESSPYSPITAENGSHYEINENIAGLRIIDTLESDEGFYLIQGDGGVSCSFELNVYGLFSYNSGTKSSDTGNYQETIYGVEGYSLIVPCDYNITEVSDAQDTFVNVDAVVNNENVMECEEANYPYCSGCEACFPILNNPFRQFVVYPTRGSTSSMLQCRVNLGTAYNGKTVDKQITILTRDISTETVSMSYNTTYQLCSNTPGDRNAVISTQSFSGGLPTNQVEYSSGNIPVLVLIDDTKISCQSLDNMGFPIANEVYEYNIEITAITDLPNTSELITESACVEEIPEYYFQFDCSYNLLGPDSNKQTVAWELNGSSCTNAMCTLSGDYDEINRVEITDISTRIQNNVRCDVELNGVPYYREWKIEFEECPTSTSALAVTVLGVSTDRTTLPTNNTMIPTTLPIDSGTLAGIITASVLCVVFVIVLLVLLVIAILLYLYCWLPDRPQSYSIDPKSTRIRNLFSHDPRKVRYTKPEDPPIITV